MSAAKDGEDHAAARRDRELAHAVLFEAEARGHAALAVDAAPERHAEQVAAEVVGPLVIGAHELARIAAIAPAEFGAAMGAAVLEDMDRAVAAARHHHRRRPDEGALEIAGRGNFRLERRRSSSTGRGRCARPRAS